MRFTVGHLFSGIGGSALGAAAAAARFGDVEATFVNVGGIDVDRQACEDFERLTGAPALCVDVHQLEPAALRAAWGPVAPDAVLASPPCKGYSGLLSKKRAAEDKYVRMNAQRAIRGAA
jgi:site-specific DNA-cytosine methylase